jgi:hypothetical protein
MNESLDPKQMGPIQLLHWGFESLQKVEETEFNAANKLDQTIIATIGLS